MLCATPKIAEKVQHSSYDCSRAVASGALFCEVHRRKRDFEGFAVWLGPIVHGKGPFCRTPPSSGTAVLVPPLQRTPVGRTVAFRDSSLSTTSTSSPPGPGYRGENSMNQSRVSVYRQTCWCHRYFDGSKPFSARAPLATAMACFSDKCQASAAPCVAQPATAKATMNRKDRGIYLTRKR